MSLDRFIRCTARRRCPRCDKPDWCLISRDGAAVICARIQSEKRVGESGWLHRLTADDRPRPRPVPTVRKPITPRPVVDFQGMHQDCIRALPHDDRLAEALGVSQEALERLGLGWHVVLGVWTFPMRDAEGKIIGLRTRNHAGEKRAVLGSQNGLFLPESNHDPVRVWIVEGPTDTAAVLELGMDAVGRPSNTGGLDFLVSWVRRNRVREAIIIVDRDPEGTHAERLTWDAAEATAKALPCRCKIVMPPAKDIRDWVRAGATRDMLLSLERNSSWAR